MKSTACENNKNQLSLTAFPSSLFGRERRNEKTNKLKDRVNPSSSYKLLKFPFISTFSPHQCRTKRFYDNVNYLIRK